MSDEENHHFADRSALLAAAITGELGEDFVDFLDSEESVPFLFLLGKIVIDFNYLEQQLKALLWAYITDSFEAGHTITSALGSTSVVSILEQAVVRENEERNIVDLVKFGGKAFDICRQNRNALAHTMTVEQDLRSDQTVWVRASRKAEYQQSQMKLSLEDLARVSNEVSQTARFLFTLQLHRNMRIRGHTNVVALPERFEIPKRLRSKDISIKTEMKKLGLYDSGTAKKP